MTVHDRMKRLGFYLADLTNRNELSWVQSSV